MQDVVIIFVTVSGRKERPSDAGNLRQQGLQRRCRRPHDAVRHPDHHGHSASAPCSTCWPKGELPPKGFVRQEEIGLDAFLKSRFGHHYEQRAYADKMAG